MEGREVGEGQAGAGSVGPDAGTEFPSLAWCDVYLK